MAVVSIQRLYCAYITLDSLFRSTKCWNESFCTTDQYVLVRHLHPLWKYGVRSTVHYCVLSNKPRLEYALCSPLCDVVSPCPRAHIEPTKSAKDMHFFEAIVADPRHDRTRRISRRCSVVRERGAVYVGVPSSRKIHKTRQQEHQTDRQNRHTDRPRDGTWDVMFTKSFNHRGRIVLPQYGTGVLLVEV